MSMHHSPLEGLLEQIAGEPLEFLIWEFWDGAREFAFLTSFQVMLLLLVLEPHFENHCSNPFAHRVQSNF